MLRVLLIANSFDPAERHAGGFIHLTEVATRWGDVELTVMAPSCARHIIERRIPILRYCATPDIRWAPRALQWLLRGVLSMPKGYALRKNCDVTLVLAPFLPDILPATAFGLDRSAVYLWHFIGDPWRRPGNRLRNLLASINESLGSALARRARVLIAGTKLVAHEFAPRGRAKTFVTSNGVDHLAPSPPVATRSGVVSVGRLHPAKGVEDLLRAWARLPAELRREGMRIVGEGTATYVRRLQVLAAELGVADSVTIVEGADDAAKVRELAAARVFAFASREEGWCIALAEAMREQLPCVTYALPVFDEVFPQGRLAVPIGDIEAFASALHRLLANESLRQRVAGEAGRTAQALTWHRAADVERIALLYAAGRSV